MITVTVDGYVMNGIRQVEGQYGPFVEVTLRAATTRRQVLYVSARFYGKKIKPLLDYVSGNDYMTISGSVGQVFTKEKENGGSYFQVYLTDAFYSLPPKVVGEAVFRPSSLSSLVEGVAGFDD